jgi:Retroviral aspartyl protease
LPKLTSIERELLYDNEGCLKCRRVFVPHHSTDCPNNFPNATNYKPLTQSFVDLIKKRVKRPIASITSTLNIDEVSVPSVPTTVAAVMGMSSNPTGYTASNRISVIEGDDFSDDSVSPLAVDPPSSPAVPLSSVLTAHPDDLAPLIVPHLYWHCCASGPDNKFPVELKALIDHGADTVFISNKFALSLKLKCRKLFKTMSVEMAMPNKEDKQVVNMTEWVKLSLYDPSGTWASKSIRAVVAPSLCAPVILGLPFLSHNKIVIDHEKRTVIAKESRFDLLNPKPTAQPRPQKKKLKEILHDLQEDCKLMVAELKMICAERACKIRNHLEQVKPVDHVAAIRSCLEELNAQDQLIQLGELVKTKYKDVFAPIPHLDDLPTDVYCRIKLKDATKTFTT